MRKRLQMRKVGKTCSLVTHLPKKKTRLLSVWLFFIFVYFYRKMHYDTQRAKVEDRSC